MHFVLKWRILVPVIKMTNTHLSFPGMSLTHALDAVGEFNTYSIHTHSHAELFYFVSGKGRYHVEGTEYPLSPGDILIMRPTEAHFIEADPNMAYERIILSFDPNIFDSIDPQGQLLRPYTQRKAGKRNLYPANAFESDTYRQYLANMLRPGADRLTIFANLLLLLKEIGAIYDRFEAEPVTPDTAEYRIIRYINKNLHQNLSLKDLSERFFLSRAQLCLRFKNATGTSVGKYITIKRLILAREKIRQGSKPTEIFAQCGYQDYSTFYRAYIRQFGYSPKQEITDHTERSLQDHISLS